MTQVVGGDQVKIDIIYLPNSHKNHGDVDEYQ